MSSSSEILIIGAGVLGLATAVELTVRGRRVTVVDPGGDNASSVAAGMIAPALECALENVTRESGRWDTCLQSGEVIGARTVVLATGPEAVIPGLTPDAARIIGLIRPIRGQLEQIFGRQVERMRRGPGAYVAPMTDGVLVGASMDFDRRDLEPDSVQAKRMIEAAGRFFDLTSLGVRRTRVGVRGASPDGLPMAGALGEGLFAALAPRRNGWLLAPAVARTVAGAIAGESKTAFSAAFDPLRF